jgi:hypothetical protein
MSQTGELMPWQRKVLETYGGGDYSEAATVEEIEGYHSDGFLDGFGYALIVELDPGEDCDSWAEASRRLETVFGEIEDAREAVDKAMPDEEDEDEVDA